MDEEILRRALNRLELDHIKILYWLDRNQNNAAIASKLKKNSTDVHFMRKFIETTLKIAGVEGVDDRARRYPPEIIHLINETIGTPPDWSKWPPSFLKSEPETLPEPSQIQGQETRHQQEEEALTRLENIVNNPEIEQEDSSGSARRLLLPIDLSWRNAGIAGLIIALLIGVFLVGRLIITGRGPTDIVNTPETQEVAQESTETQTGNVSILPSGTPTISLDGTMTQEAINLQMTEDNMTAVAAIETAEITDTPTLTPAPTDTPPPSLTPTITPTPTETPTLTPTPVILGVGEAFTDDRISVELIDAGLNREFLASNARRVTAAVVFNFKFTSLITQDDFYLTFIYKDFTLTDNLGREYEITKTDGGFSWANTQVSRVLKPSGEFNFNIGFGRQGDFDDKVEYLIIKLNDFSSLGDISWRRDIEN